MSKPISAALISVAGTMLSDGERRLIEQYRPLGVSLLPAISRAVPSLPN